MEPIYFKGGCKVVFPNMSAYAIEVDGEVWMTVEHAYQAVKFSDEATKDQIRQARSAYDAKVIAEENKTNTAVNWSNNKLEVMERLLRLKLIQHPHVKKKLLETGEAELIEDTDDSFWGRGADGNGANNLGKLWIKLRAEYNQKV